jgi:hypothetical protein
MPGFSTASIDAVPIVQEAGWARRAGLAPQGLDLWTVHSKASRYTKCAILATVLRRYPLQIWAIFLVFLSDADFRFL